MAHKAYGPGGSIVENLVHMVVSKVAEPVHTPRNLHRALSSPLVLTASTDGSARLWDMYAGDCLRVLPCGGEVACALFCADGDRVLTVSASGVAKIWATQTGECVLTLPGYPAGALSVALSGDGASLLATFGGAQADLYGVPDCTLMRTYAGHSAAVTSVAFASGDQFVLTASHDGAAKLWTYDVLGAGATCERTFVGDDGPMRSAVMSSDDAMVVTASDSGVAKIWDATEGTCLKVLEGHDWPLWSAAFSPDCQSVVVASRDGRATIWRVRDARKVCTFRGHGSTVRSAVFSQDGKAVLTASADGTARLWSENTGECLAIFRGHRGAVCCAAVQPWAAAEGVRTRSPNAYDEAMIGGEWAGRDNDWSSATPLALCSRRRDPAHRSNESSPQQWKLLEGCFVPHDHFDVDEDMEPDLVDVIRQVEEDLT